jgi:hypothetical protein
MATRKTLVNTIADRDTAGAAAADTTTTALVTDVPTATVLVRFS